MKKITVILLSLCIALCLAFMFVSCDNGSQTGESGCNHEYGEEFIMGGGCTEPGTLRKICKLCGVPKDTPIEAPGHTWITDNEKLPSCTSDGYRNSRCEKCGTTNYEELKATGHKYEYGVQTQPTQESTGTLSYGCINQDCSNYGTAEMPVLTDSAYTKEVVDADTTYYTYNYEGNAVKFTVSSYVIYPVFYYGENPLKFELYKITDYTGSNKNLTLPTTWNGGYVVEIDERAFQNCEEIESVTIPKFSFSYTIDDVREEYREEFLAEMGEPDADGKYYYVSYDMLPEYAFYGCASLKTVTLPDTVVAVYNNAFGNCVSLEQINLAKVTYIGEYALSETKITSVDLSSAEIIGEFAFFNCNDLADVKLGNSLGKIHTGAFQNCRAITTLVIPDSVEKVGGAILEGCTGIKNLTVPKVYWGSFASLFSGYLNGGIEYGSYYDSDSSSVPALDCVTITKQTEIPDSAFEGCTVIKKIILPSNTTSIGKRAFYGCNSLVDFKIPDGIQTIGSEAFGEIDNLYFFKQDFDNKAYYIASESNPYFYLMSVDSYASRTEFTIQSGCKYVAYDAFKWCDNITRINIPSSVEYLGTIRYATGHSVGSELSLYFDGTVERFTELGFACGGWESLYLYVKDSQGYKEVTELVISDKVIEIQTGPATTYGRFVNFTSVRIPKETRAFGADAFRFSSITTVYYEGTLKDWLVMSFDDEDANPMIAATQLYMAGDTSKNWADATEIALPQGATRIKEHTLVGFDKLETLVIPSSVVGVSYDAYAVCEELSEIYFQGTAQRWKSVCSACPETDEVTKYFYTETQPSLEVYLEGKDATLWHYNSEDEIELWSAKRGTTVNGKKYAYVSSSANLSDAYWQMVLMLKENNMVGELGDPDLIAMINRSSTKAELEAELAVYYATTAEGLTLTFASQEVLLEQKGDSTTLGYLEFKGVIYYTLTGGAAFTVSQNGSALVEQIVTEYFTITHNYSVVNE